jgi:uncharacterized membrane protein YphA (DoxX/SURF4 family)
MAPSSAFRVRVVAMILGAIFIAVGATELVQTALAVSLFDAFGLPHWSLVVVGAIEIATGVLVLQPRTRSWGAMLVCVIMTFAALAHVVTAVGLEGLALHFFFFATGLWLARQAPPRSLAPDWVFDPHQARLSRKTALA